MGKIKETAGAFSSIPSLTTGGYVKISFFGLGAGKKLMIIMASCFLLQANSLFPLVKHHKTICTTSTQVFKSQTIKFLPYWSSPDPFPRFPHLPVAPFPIEKDMGSWECDFWMHRRSKMTEDLRISARFRGLSWWIFLRENQEMGLP